MWTVGDSETGLREGAGSQGTRGGLGCQGVDLYLDAEVYDRIQYLFLIQYREFCCLGPVKATEVC